jgi:hypothetical protein
VAKRKRNRKILKKAVDERFEADSLCALLAATWLKKQKLTC